MPELTAATGSTGTPAGERHGAPAMVYAVAGVSALGGLLFGYDTGIISGALLHLRDDMDLSSREQEVVVSVILLGAMAGALLAGRLAVRHGRRKVVIAVAVVFALGAAAAAAAPGVGALIAARFVLGLAVGGASNMVPVYIAEAAPAGIRGRLMVLFQLMVACGQLIAYLCGWALSDGGDWRTMFALAVLPPWPWASACCSCPRARAGSSSGAGGRRRRGYWPGSGRRAPTCTGRSTRSPRSPPPPRWGAGATCDSDGCAPPC